MFEKCFYLFMNTTENCFVLLVGPRVSVVVVATSRAARYGENSVLFSGNRASIAQFVR